MEPTSDHLESKYHPNLWVRTKTSLIRACVDMVSLDETEKVSSESF